MHFVRDASGRQVSLLNDEPNASLESVQLPCSSQPYRQALARSVSSSPNTPELLRSDSYDSQTSNEPISPLTPSMMYSEYGQPMVYAPEARQPFDEYMMNAADTTQAKRPGSFGDSRTMSYEDGEVTSPSAGSGTTPAERVGKRYPCRFRDSHHCEKTFTTSGHASRHSKIHTAEKAVHCTFSGCAKKFTRADNMKQHLETHYKDKSRSSSRPSLASSRRHSSSSKSSTRSSAARSPPPLPSPSLASGGWDMRGMNLPLHTRPGATRTPSGLDALAMVAAQEGA